MYCNRIVLLLGLKFITTNNINLMVLSVLVISSKKKGPFLVVDVLLLGFIIITDTQFISNCLMILNTITNNLTRTHTSNPKIT